MAVGLGELDEGLGELDEGLGELDEGLGELDEGLAGLAAHPTNKLPNNANIRKQTVNFFIPFPPCFFALRDFFLPYPYFKYLLFH